MINYKCKALSPCENFQTGICLHCNHRLCTQHLIDHHTIIFSNVQSLLNLVEVAHQQIKDKWETNRIKCDDDLPTLEKRRTEILEKIEQIYQDELEIIAAEEKILENYCQDLLEQLDHKARQPLEYDKKQHNISNKTLNLIRQTVEVIRKESTQLKWDLPMSSVINSEYSASNSSLLLTSEDVPKQSVTPDTKEQTASPPFADLGKSTFRSKDNVLLNGNESLKAKNENPTREHSSAPMKMKKCRAPKRLVRMFANISSIKQSKDKIDIHLKGGTKLFVLVYSYLQAWHNKSKLKEKVFILNEHISTIKKYQSKSNSEFDILIGIQIFIFNNKFTNNEGEITSYLLQFFLKHEVITENLILNWFNSETAQQYGGFEAAKQLILTHYWQKYHKT